MRKSNVVAFVLSSLAVGLIVACGSSPKPDATPPTPSATPAMTASAMPDDTDGGGGAAMAGDAGGGAADAGMTKEQECAALRDDAQSTLDAERIDDKPCKKDADCMPAKGRACEFVCTNIAIPKSEQKDWDKDVAKVKDGPCKKWADMGCKKADAKPPTCEKEKMKAACDKGHCILK